MGYSRLPQARPDDRVRALITGPERLVIVEYLPGYDAEGLVPDAEGPRPEPFRSVRLLHLDHHLDSDGAVHERLMSVIDLDASDPAPSEELLVVTGYEQVDPDLDHEVAWVLKEVPHLTILILLRAGSRRAPNTDELPGVRLTSRDLAWTPAQVDQYLEERGVDRSPLLTGTELVEGTNGWPALIRLITDTVEAHSSGTDEAHRTLISRTTQSFHKEIASTLDQAVIEPLHILAVPDQITDGRWRPFLTAEQADRLLDGLERHGFARAVPTDDGEAAYVLRPLLRDALRADFRVSDLAEYRRVNRVLTDQSLDRGDPASAAQHALNANEPGRAADIIDRYWARIFRQSRLGVRTLIDQLPRDVLDEHPACRLVDEFSRPMVPKTDANLDLIEAVWRSARTTRDRHLQLSLSLVLLIALRRRGQLGFANEVGAFAKARAEALLEETSEGLPGLVTGIGLHYGFVQQLSGDLEAAEHTFEMTQYYREAFPSIAYDTAAKAAFGAALRGENRRADAWLDRIDEEWPHSWQRDMELISYHNARAWLALDRLDLAEARQQLDSPLPPLLKPDDQWTFSLYTRAQLALVDGDQQGVLQRIEQYCAYYSQRMVSGSLSRTLLLTAQAELNLSIGRTAAAEFIIRDEQPHPLVQLSRARILLYEGRHDAVLSAVSHGLWSDSLWPRTRLELLLTRAEAQAAAGRRTDAVSTMREALILWERHPLNHSVARIEPDLLPDLVNEEPALHQMITALAGYAPPTDSRSARQRAALTKREAEILHYLALGHTSAAIAKELFVSLHTVKTALGKLYRKLGVSSRSDAVDTALRIGLMKPPDQKSL